MKTTAGRKASQMQHRKTTQESTRISISNGPPGSPVGTEPHEIPEPQGMRDLTHHVQRNGVRMTSDFTTKTCDGKTSWKFCREMIFNPVVYSERSSIWC
jgi:hypothetical protein